MNLIFAELNDKELAYLLNPEITGVFVLFRGYGYSCNKQLLEEAVTKTDIETAYTNDETLLNESVLFNNETKRYNIYFYNKETHKNVWIHDIYENLRRENDLTRMYYCGLFDFKLAGYGIKQAISKKDFPEGDNKNEK